MESEDVRLAARRVGSAREDVMNGSRRKLLHWIGGATAGAVLARPAFCFSQQSFPQGQAQDPRQPNSDPSVDPAMAAAARKAMLEQNQKDIKKSVEKLFDLAKELKEQVDKTDSATVLSLSLVRKAEEIEKLARQIKDRAKG